MGKQARRVLARRRRTEAPSTAQIQRIASTPAEFEESRPTCPRCQSPVEYGGRGRRPIWCSARCRVDASIERRGNRMVGIQPQIVEVVRISAGSTAPVAKPPAAGRRTVQQWTDVPDDFSRAISSGAVYDRELAQLVDPINGVLLAFRRREVRR